uniref:Uncharacterized protein n=1 Tax=Grapevine Kizil Sapak virus TaxID=2650001 RepID=A0A646RQV1_9VIRU|nr:hypothetical protein [Grapevine Kizil Sapak virus]
MTQGLYLQLYSLINKGFSLSSLYSSMFKILHFPSWANKFVPFTKVKEKHSYSDGSVPRYRICGFETLRDATSAFHKDMGSGYLVCCDWSPDFKPDLLKVWPNIDAICGAVKPGYRKPSKVWAKDFETLEAVLSGEVTQNATRDVEVLRSVDGSLQEFEDEVGQGGSGYTLQVPASPFSRDDNEPIWMASVER